MSTTHKRRDFDKQLAIIFLSRTVLNTAHRIIYPFLPSLARGLGISFATASQLVTLRVLANMTAPVLGPLSDRYGRRRFMEFALLIFIVASVLLAGVGTVAAAALAFIGYGLAKALFDPAVHAYVGDMVPYSERGRAIGIVEFSWAGAWLLGVPASGFLIERFGWRAPWGALILLGIVGAWLIHAGLPATDVTGTSAGSSRTEQTQRSHPISDLLTTWRSLIKRRNVVVILLVSSLFTFSIETPFIVYGAWLEDTFGLQLGALGLASAVIGIAEAVAEFGTAVITDRLGKERSVVAGMLGLAGSLVLLPWLPAYGLAAALGGVVLMMLTFEFGLVSLLSLATEVAPDARAALLSFVVTAFSLGRLIGGPLGGWLWKVQPNIAYQAGLGIVCSLAASALLVWGIRGVGE